MSKLYFYRNVGKHVTKFAEGDGTVSSTAAFNVTLSSGSVKQGTVYEIRQGGSTSGELYNCTVGASKNGTATFKLASAMALERLDTEHFGATLALQAALEATSKIIHVQVADDDLESLKSSKYKLCFAKKIADHDYNVVWQSSDKYTTTTTFSWVPMYELFGTNTFKDSVTVKADTKHVRIGLGQTSTLDPAGLLQDAVSGGPDISITMANQYGDIRPGLTQIASLGGDSTASQPFYVAPLPIKLGSVALTPVDSVLIWFEQNIQTSTMFSTARSNTQELDMTTKNEVSVLYKDGKWSLV
jgi:hypothetical protein